MIQEVINILNSFINARKRASDDLKKHKTKSRIQVFHLILQNFELSLID